MLLIRLIFLIIKRI